MIIENGNDISIADPKVQPKDEIAEVNEEMLQEKLDNFPSDEESSTSEKNNDSANPSENPDEQEGSEMAEEEDSEMAEEQIATKKSTKKRNLNDLWLSICIPDSCIQKCQSPE